MKSHAPLYALSFVLLNVLIYSGVEWLVWFFLAPFILLSVRCPLRSILTLGSIAVMLIGYLWLWWLSLYTVQTLVIALTALYLFFMSFALALQTLGSVGFLRSGYNPEGPIGNTKAQHTGLRLAIHVFTPPTIWFCLEKIASYSAIGSSWIDLAMFQSTMAPLIWVIGARGITFVIVLFNSIVAVWLYQRSTAVTVWGILLSTIIAGCIAYSTFASIGGDTLKVALLQGNFPQTWEWRREEADRSIIDTYLDMSKGVMEERPDIIAWPEYAIPADVFLKKDLFEKITTMARDTGSPIVLGTLAELGGIVNGEDRILNLAAMISPQPENTPHDRYVSVHPAPFEKATIAGSQIHTIATGKAKLGVLLCFEEMLPDISAQLARDGAELILALANNNSFNQSKGIYLTSLQTKLRAAENCRYLARVTNTGITQVINPCGKIVAEAKPFSRESLVTQVRLSNRVTPYSRYGDVPLMTLIIGVWIGIFMLKLSPSLPSR